MFKCFSTAQEDIRTRVSAWLVDPAAIHH
ncbi:hypothetical protein CGRA01v4_03255 [Colletotrichum graminicola]|nr:hypothetical protein CGRA01v4_03255 [Colletotrichum graminicola]